eukprot:TRINITY_DN57550_c0_g1_i1.p1 TRINITY_DN57550_c0_g1~~TRINITY_DN57550_c0_g1_i1.p1  ORF type:complete len:211 (-),score=25.15 TRINITY_DN57550_c0_g1_i1:317-949(-)
MQELHGNRVAKYCHDSKLLNDRVRYKSRWSTTSAAVDTGTSSQQGVGTRFHEGDFVQVWSKTACGWWLALITQCEEDLSEPNSDAILVVEYDIPGLGYCRKKVLCSSKCLRAASSDPKQHCESPRSSDDSETEEIDPEISLWGGTRLHPSTGFPVFVNIYSVGDARSLRIINSVLAPRLLPVKICGVFHAGVAAGPRQRIRICRRNRFSR